MSNKSTLSIGRLILHIALGVMLAVAGIWALQGKGGRESDAIRHIFSNFDANIRNGIVIAFGVIELLAGILLIAAMFSGGRFGKFDNLLMIVVMIVWIVAIILIDFLSEGGILNGGADDFLGWLHSFAGHLIVLGAMVCLND